MTRILGNDVASFQKDINFDEYSRNSQFIIVKASEGTTFKDPKLVRNQSEARRVGLGLGYYHFARPDTGNTPEKEAAWFLSCIGTIRSGEVLVLDYEPNNQIQAWVDWCKAFLDFVFNKTNCRPLIYLNQSQVKQFNWKSVVDANYGLWIAAYTNSPDLNNGNIGQWPFAVMQQWTSSQQIAGISGNVDGDVFFGDIATFKKYGYQGAVTPTPTPPTDSNMQPMKQIIIDTYRALCGADPSEDEISYNLKQGINTYDLIRNICSGDVRFTNTWVLPQINVVATKLKKIKDIVNS